MSRRKRADSRRGQRVCGRLSVTPQPAPDTAGYEPNTRRALDKKRPEARIRWRTRTEEFPRGAAVPAEVEHPGVTSRHVNGGDVVVIVWRVQLSRVNQV